MDLEIEQQNMHVIHEVDLAENGLAPLRCARPAMVYNFFACLTLFHHWFSLLCFMSSSLANVVQAREKNSLQT